MRYGDHERQVLDFYKAKSDRPTPLVFFIHGGGWVAGDKKGVNAAKPYLAARHFGRLDQLPLFVAGAARRREAAGEGPAGRRGAGACSSCAARRRSGTSTSNGLARAAARPALLVVVAGLPRRHGRSEEQRPDRTRIDALVDAPPWSVRRLRSTRRSSRNGRPTAATAATPSASWTRTTSSRATRASRNSWSTARKLLPWIKEYSPIELRHAPMTRRSI